MVDLFKKQRVTIYEIEEGVDFNIGTMPNVTIGSMPNVTVTSMPNVTIDTMPNVTIGTMPNVIISTMPNVTIGSMPNVVVASGSITLSSGTVTIDGGDVNIASKYNLAKFGTFSFTQGDAVAPDTSFMSMLDDDTSTYFRVGFTSAGAKTTSFQWDFGEAKTIKTCVVFFSMLENGGHETCTCALQRSANGTDWVTIDSGTGTGEAGNGTYDNLLGVNQTYRYFRILLTQTGTGTTNSLFVYDLQLII